MSDNKNPDHGSVMVAPKGHDHGGPLSTVNAVPYVLEKWDVSNPDAFVVWNMSLTDIVDEATCVGFIDSKFPSADDLPRLSNRKHNTRLAADLAAGEEAAFILELGKEWRKHDALFFRILLKSVILNKRQGSYVATHFHPLKSGHGFYSYIRNLSSQTSESAILKNKGVIEALTIDPNADADTILGVFDTISDCWGLVPSFNQTEAAKIKHAITLFPKEHHATQYLSALQAMVDVGGGNGASFDTFTAFSNVVVERVRVHNLREPTHSAFAGLGRHEQHQQRNGDRQGGQQGGGEQRKYKPSVTPCKSCDMGCCPADSRCCVCVMTDDEVRNMKVRKGAKFVIFVMRGWKKDRKLTSMKGVVPDQEYFKKKLAEAKTYRESQGAKETSAPCIEDIPDENFWEMLNGESSLMNIASEVDVDNHFADEILCPPFDPYVKPSDVETMSTIDMLVAESESVFGSPVASKEIALETLEPRTEAKMLPSRESRMQELLLTPIHLESERLIGADTSESGRSVLPDTSSSVPPGSTHAAPSLTEVLVAQKAEPKVNEFSQAEKDALLLRLDEARWALEAVRARNVEATALARAAIADERESRAIEVAQLQYRVEWYADKAKDLVDTQSSLRKELVVSVTECKKHVALAEKGKLAGLKLGLISKLSRRSGHDSKWLHKLIATAGVASFVLFRLKAPPRIVAGLDAILKALLDLSISSSISAVRAVPLLFSFIQRAFAMARRIGAMRAASRPNTIELTTPRTFASQPLHFPYGDSSAVLMVTSGVGKRSAILYDPGCTAVMTNSLEGMIGTLSKASNSFVTAAGPKSFSQKAFMVKTIYGSNGTSVDLRTNFYYEASLPFDIYGSAVLRSCLGSIYVDSDHPTAPTYPAVLRLLFAGDIELPLGRTTNGLEWLSYQPPRQIAAPVWETCDAELHAACSNAISTGAGMGKLGAALSELEKATLDHMMRGHPSLRRQLISSRSTVGGLTLTKMGLKMLAALGCDHCNAYKIKLVDPKEHHSIPPTVKEVIRFLLYDVFGLVPYKSVQYGYQYGHLFVAKQKKIGWLKGSKTLDETTVVAIHRAMVTELEAYFPGEKVQIVRMDSFSSNKGKAMMRLVPGGYDPCAVHAARPACLPGRFGALVVPTARALPDRPAAR